MCGETLTVLRDYTAGLEIALCAQCTRLCELKLCSLELRAECSA